jgi:D-alanine-D-alanine ligase
VRVTILHDAVSPDAAPDALDLLHQVEAVEAALLGLGHAVTRLPCDLDLARVERALRAAPPDLVFNLVEGLAGTARLLSAPASLLETLGLAFTGSRPEPLFVTTQKLLAKARLADAGLPTPWWSGGPRARSPAPFRPGRHIVKSVWEHASLGLGDDAVLEVSTEAALDRAIAARGPALGGRAFGEAFVEGRELNVGLLARADGRPEVLPVAEILFEDFPAEKPRIVGYASKWLEDSFEYHHTPRRLAFGPGDAPLLDRVRALALACWERFDLEGYARVDFRVDAAGAPWILEVNANPCLAPDAGFAVMVEAAGESYAGAVARVVAAATGGRG